MRHGLVIREGLLVVMEGDQRTSYKPAALYHRGRRVAFFRTLADAKRYALKEFPAAGKGEE